MNHIPEYLAGLAHDLRAAVDTAMTVWRRCRALRRGACPDTVEF